MATWSQAINQQLLDKYFGAGAVQAGGGRGDAAIASAPQALRDAYIKERQGYDGQQGYTVAAAVNPTTSYNGGVSPVGQVEPLNQWQKDALTMQQGGATDPGYGNAIFQALQGQQGAANNIPTSLDDNTFQSLYKRFNDPYQQDVINNSNAEIQRQGDILKNPIKEQLAGNNSFGSSAQGIENGQVDEATLRAITNNTSALNSAGYQSSVGNALNNYGQDSANSLNRAGAFQNLLGAGIAGQQQNQNNFSQNVGNKFNAGSAVQNQNQNLLNVVRGQISGVQQYPYTQLSNFSQLLSPYTGSSSTGYSYSPSSVSQFGGLGLLAGSGLFGNLGGGSSAATVAPAVGYKPGFLGSAY